MISVENLTFGYPTTDDPVVSGITLEVTTGRTTAVMGSNGAGKSTLLKLLAGLLEPDEGSIRIDGRDVGSATTTEAAEVVGFGPEDASASFFARTVTEEVEFFPKNRELDVERRSREAMEQTGVYHLRDRSPLSLSAGEQRRVSIASILSGDPSVVLLDEPTQSLHRTGEREIGELLSELEQTVVFTTHSADFAYEIADEVVVLNEGRIARGGDPESVLADEELLETAGIRLPGIVEWAARRSLDRIPADFEQAVAMAKRDRSGDST